MKDGKEYATSLEYANGLIVRLNQQLTEKDATIESLGRNNQAWQTELRRERQSTTQMRRALEEARSYFGDIATFTTDKDASKVASRAFNMIVGALEEGDKE
ncbi:hypothetical protein D3C74_224150 [compost metagenome]